MFKKGLAITIMILLLAGCSSGGDSNSNSNSKPIINNISAKTDVSCGEEIEIAADVTDGDNDNLTYSWSATEGEITGEGANVSYVAPQTESVVKIGLLVSDGKVEVSDTISINVNESDSIISSINGKNILFFNEEATYVVDILEGYKDEIENIS